MSEEPENPDRKEDLPELDPMDPLKRDPEKEDERMPGWDPVVAPIPPEE
jgi:hypothetical protein